MNNYGNVCQNVVSALFSF